mgnify:CR=1 FL=1
MSVVLQKAVKSYVGLVVGATVGAGISIPLVFVYANKGTGGSGPVFTERVYVGLFAGAAPFTMLSAAGGFLVGLRN